MSAARRAVAAGLLAGWLGAAGPAQAAPVRGLTAGAQVREAYDAILGGRFDEWPAIARATCPPAPAQVCQTLELAALWWQIQVDPANRSLDTRFVDTADRAVDAMEAWTGREPERAEAWFYRGAAYGARAQFRVLRGERLSAARDGKRIKDALERALALDPGLQDAWFGIGLYHYYADVAPAAAKVLRFLLFLPGGDRKQGLAEMRRARDNGALLAGEIDYQLHVIDLWYEHDPRRALALLDGLRRRYPANPHFVQTIAEVQETYLHDSAGSLRTWRALADAAQAGRVRQAAMALGFARLGTAAQLDRLFETDLAIAELRTLIASRPSTPAGVMVRAHVQLGEALSRMGQAADAAAAFRTALALAPGGGDMADRARAGLRRTPPADQTTAYRLSLQGWRALERGDTGAAAPLIAQAVALRPADPVHRYREARLLIAMRDDAGAERALARVLAAKPEQAPTIYAAACLDAGAIAERRRDSARASEFYRRAEQVFGADARTVADATRARERLRTP
ncbi:MAG: tetratricopeptide repeat protein [Vicinamibacterales bacterium]